MQRKEEESLSRKVAEPIEECSGHVPGNTLKTKLPCIKPMLLAL